MSHVINSHDMGTWDFHVTFYFLLFYYFFPYKYQSIWNFFIQMLSLNLHINSSFSFSLHMHPKSQDNYFFVFTKNLFFFISQITVHDTTSHPGVLGCLTLKKVSCVQL